MKAKKTKNTLYPISYGNKAFIFLSKALTDDELRDLIKRCHYIAALYKKDGKDIIKKPFTAVTFKAFREETSGTTEVVEEAIINSKYKFVYKSKREVNKEYNYLLLAHVIYFYRDGVGTPIRLERFEHIINQFEDELARREQI